MVEIPDYLLERSQEARARLTGVAPSTDSQSESVDTAVVAAAESAPARRPPSNGTENTATRRLCVCACM